MPYEPDPNLVSACFFRDFHALAAELAPDLVLKSNPNGDGVRPTRSRPIYADVARCLRDWPGIPRPRMSIQAWDSGARSASVKIMLGGCARQADRLAV